MQLNQIHVTNRAPYPRREPVVWGSRYTTPVSYRETPCGTGLNVAWVDVPANFSGLLTPTECPPGPFTLHPAVRDAMLTGGFRPYVEANGRAIDLEPGSAPEVADPRCITTVWKGRTADLIAELVVTLFSNHHIANFALRLTCESKASSSAYITTRFMVGTGRKALTYVYDLDDASSLHQPVKELRTPTPMGDAQSCVVRGVVMFYTDEMLNDPANTASLTCLAALYHPLYPMAEWTSWGIWSKAVTPGNYTAQIVNERGHLDFVDWRNPTVHPEMCILGKRPANSGEQAEFGSYSHVVDVSAQTSELMWRKTCAADREALRPIAYYEQDGARVMARAHPRWTVWSEETHWSTGVSPDRLGRTHAGSDSAGWFGHDDQHQGWIFLPEHYLLTGDITHLRMMRQIAENWKAALTTPSDHPGYATNDPGPGRAVGRWFEAIAQVSRCVYDGELITQAEKRFLECVYPQWLRMKVRGGVIAGYTYIEPDARTGFPLQETWAAWQDSILVQGLHAFFLVCGRYFSASTNAKLEEMVRDVGRSFVEYGYTPSGDVAVAYVPIPNGMPPINYYDPTLCTLYTGFNVWGLQAIGVVQHMLPDLAQRCASLRARYEPQARDTYTGTLP